MTTLEIKGDWNITKGKLKQKWDLFLRIQNRTGESREVVEKAVKESCSACCGWLRYCVGELLNRHPHRNLLRTIVNGGADCVYGNNRKCG